MRRLLCTMAVLLLLLPAQLTAQERSHSIIKGRVVDAATEEPLPGAHVYISESMHGSVADEEGYFELSRVPPGLHRLHVSMLGYESATRDTLIQAAHTYTLNFRLEETVLPAGELTVEDQRDARWERRLRRFERKFLGESFHSEQTEILNPEVLRFETTWWGRLNASAVEPLVIENRALGYRLTYDLTEFSDTSTRTQWDGEPFFEPLESESEEEAERWEENRRRTYHGSFRHFMLALWDDRLQEEDYMVERVEDQESALRYTGRETRWHVDPERLFRETDESAEDDSVRTRELFFRGRLEIVYTGQEQSPEYIRWESRRVNRPQGGYQRSYLELNDGAVTVDETGDVAEPYGITRFGYFAFERIAALLPKSYRPE